MQPGKNNLFIVIMYLLLAVMLLPSMLLPSRAWSQQTLSLQQAEQLALESDPLSKSHMQRALAFEDQSVAVNQWPDPKLKFGFLSLPTDSFDLDQEPMTQIVLGLQQALPRGDSLHYLNKQMQAKATIKRADVELRLRQVKLAVHKSWYQVYLQQQSAHILRKNRRLFEEQLEVSQSLYAAGKNQQQDVLQAQLELSLLDDQLQQIASLEKQARALLSQWVGHEIAQLPMVLSSRSLSSGSLSTGGLSAGQLSTEDGNQQSINGMAALISAMSDHPELKQMAARIASNRQAVQLARQKYKPQWSFDVSYGKRDGENIDGSDRADFVSALVSIDLPVFTEQKQDRELAARKKQLQASQYEIIDTRLRIIAQLKKIYAHWMQLQQRLKLYDQKVLPQSRQNARAALNGYQSGVISFFTLTRARSAELKAQLQRLKLDVEKAISYAEISFLIGEGA